MQRKSQRTNTVPVAYLNRGTYYDYDRQAWIVDGKVDKCGHREPMPGCYACSHAGERV